MPIIGSNQRKLPGEYLSPSERLAEILFGLIMALTVISSLTIALPRNEMNATAIIIITLACNVAWGFVDGTIYILTSTFERKRFSKLVREIGEARGDKSSIEKIEDELEATIIGMLPKDERRRIYQEILESTYKPVSEESRILKSELIGALACFLIVTVSAIPLTIPFLIIGDTWNAARITDLIAIVMLFLIGYHTAIHTGRHGIRGGLSMVVIGLFIALATVALGG